MDRSFLFYMWAADMHGDTYFMDHSCIIMIKVPTVYNIQEKEKYHCATS